MTEIDTQANASHDPKWAPATRYIVGIGLVLAVIALFSAISGALTVVIAAALIAFLVQPSVNGLRRRFRLPRGLAVGITYLGVLLVIILILVLVIPAIVNTLQSFARLDWGGTVAEAKAWLENVLTDLVNADLGIAGLNRQVDRLFQPLLDALQGAGTVETPEPADTSRILSTIGDALSISVSAIAGIAGGVVSVVLSFAMMMVFSIYISLASPRFQPGLIKLVPPRYREEANELINRLLGIWRGYLHGELRLMVIIGGIVAVGNVLLGTPAPLFLGIISGLMEVVPGIGPALALIPGVAAALIGGSSTLSVSNLVFALIVVIFYEGVQLFENNFITPRVIGKSVNLDPLLVLVAMFVAGSVVGLIGAVLTVPVLASGIEIVRYLYFKVLGEDPFPPQDEAPHANNVLQENRCDGTFE
jgi:predicted PurR-regulated permease PerM